jgi:hypothetical protein
MKGQLTPRYLGPFPILKKCGPVAYKLELLLSLVGVHDIFRVSQLKKCLKAPVDFTYPEHPIKILDQKDHVMRCKTIKFFKVPWSNNMEEATQESKNFLYSRHPDFDLP